MSLSNEDVRDILALLDSLPHGEFTLRTSRFALRLRRGPSGIWAQETSVLAEPVPVADPERPAPGGGGPPRPGGPAADPAANGPAANGPAANGPAANGPAANGLAEIRAPLLGTFYRAPQPGAPPFVEVGSKVGQDSVVAIIETMKLMNPVYAGMAGTVAQICLADGEFAPEDAVLMLLRPTAG